MVVVFIIPFVLFSQIHRSPRLAVPLGKRVVAAGQCGVDVEWLGWVTISLIATHQVGWSAIYQEACF